MEACWSRKRTGPGIGAHPKRRRAIDGLTSGRFSGGNRERFRPSVESLLSSDPNMLMADDSGVQIQRFRELVRSGGLGRSP